MDSPTHVLGLQLTGMIDLRQLSFCQLMCSGVHARAFRNGQLRATIVTGQCWISVLCTEMYYVCRNCSRYVFALVPEPTQKYVFYMQLPGHV